MQHDATVVHFLGTVVSDTTGSVGALLTRGRGPNWAFEIFDSLYQIHLYLVAHGPRSTTLKRQPEDHARGSHDDSQKVERRRSGVVAVCLRQQLNVGVILHENERAPITEKGGQLVGRLTAGDHGEPSIHVGCVEMLGKWTSIVNEKKTHSVCVKPFLPDIDVQHQNGFPECREQGKRCIFGWILDIQLELLMLQRIVGVQWKLQTLAIQRHAINHRIW